MDAPAANLPNALLPKAKRVNQELLELYNGIRSQGGENPDQELCEILKANLCRLTQLLVPNAHQKMDEIIFAAENPELTVLNHQHGADLIDKTTGKHFELKESKCTVRSPTCNFNWPVPAGKTKEERRTRLLASVTHKVGFGGSAVFIVRDGLRNIIAQFKFSEGFLLGYFGRITIGCGNHNLGCMRCDNCGDFHKLRKLQQANDTFAKDPSKVDWKHVLAPTSSTCITAPTAPSVAAPKQPTMPKAPVRKRAPKKS